MTSPVKVSTNTSATTAFTSSHTVALPSGIDTVGRLIILLISYSNAGGTAGGPGGNAVWSGWPANWTTFHQNEYQLGGDNGFLAAYHYTDGTEGYTGDGSDTIALTTDQNNRAAFQTYLWSGAENPSTQAPEATSVGAANSAADPPSISPTGGTKDYSFIAVAAPSLGGPNNTIPTNYIEEIENNTGGTNANHSYLATAYRSVSVSSEDPSAFASSTDGTQEVVAATVAIHPVGGPPPETTLDQDSFRGRDDDVALNSATFNGGGGLNTNWSQAVSVNFRVRWLIQETAGDSGADKQYELWYDLNGAGYVEMTASTPIQPAATTQYANGDTTTQVLGSGTYVTGESAGGVDDATDTGNIDWAGNDEAEMEWALTIDTAQVSNNDTIALRVRRAGGGILESYTNTPTITVVKADTGLAQPNFRIREDDSQGLNVDAGWKEALNTDTTMDAGKIFRIRFEVETEDANNFAHKIVARHKPFGGAYGSWTDVGEIAVVQDDATSMVWVLPSAQFNDGDATTNLLSGSAKSFVAGDGNENKTTGTVNLTNQHTEFEFALLIKGFWGGPNRVKTGDEIQFRLIRSDDVEFTGSYVTPTITVNMPVGYIGAPFIESSDRIGPFKDTNGNLYYLIEPVGAPGANNNEPEFIKSTDGGDSWDLVHIAGSPAANDIEAAGVFQAGDTLHVLIQHGNGPDVIYNTFRMSDHSTNPDTWGIIDESVEASTGSSDQACGVVARSDGTVVAVYRSVSGAADRPVYNIRSAGGTWGGGTAVLSSGATDYTFSGIVLGASDKTHIFVKDTSSGIMYHKSLDSGDTLSAEEAVESDAGTDADDWAAAGVVYWDDAGAEKIMILVRDDSDSLLYSVVITDDGTPETRKQVSDNIITNDPAGVNSRQPVADLVVDPATDTIYAFMSWQSNRDIYRDQSANDGGWGTDASLLPNVTVDQLRGQIFTHSPGNGGDKVYGYTYDEGGGDAGFTWYREYVIAAAGVGGQPYQQRTRRPTHPADRPRAWN
jgi:hypothetical protein